jgi:rifampicin phosphotransferase
VGARDDTSFPSAVALVDEDFPRSRNRGVPRRHEALGSAPRRFTTVNGFVYICARGAGAPKGAKGHPPKFIFKLLSKMQPEVRRRIRRSAEVFETKLWRKDVEEWDNVTKPGFTRRYTELQAVDAASLSDQELSKHLDDCRDADRQSVVIHHTWNSVAMIPMGDFLIQTTKGPECARPI